MQGSCVPSIPGRPRIVKVIGSEVTLTWTQPDSDGGSEITGYVVAYLVPDRNVAHQVTVGVTTTAKLNLPFVCEGPYVFAVAANNAFGTGDYSPLSEKVKIRSYTGNKLFLLHYCVVNIVLLMLSCEQIVSVILRCANSVLCSKFELALTL